MNYRPADKVYVIEAQNGVIKIGCSRDPRSRAATINSTSPIPCRLIAQWSGTIRDETVLKNRFALYRSHCEWFRVEGQVVDFVAEVRGRGVEIEPWFSASEHARRAEHGRMQRIKTLWVRRELNMQRTEKLTGMSRYRLRPDIYYGPDYERVTGVSRHELRPDLYPTPAGAAA